MIFFFFFFQKRLDEILDNGKDGKGSYNDKDGKGSYDTKASGGKPKAAAKKS